MNFFEYQANQKKNFLQSDHRSKNHIGKLYLHKTFSKNI